MTWYYKITDAGNLSVYDHNQDHVTTRMNDGTGHRLPNDLLETIGEQLDEHGWSFDQWGREAMKTALVEDFEELDS